MAISQVQLGKQGVTENFIHTLESHFKKHDIVKISVLKSCCRDREELKEMANKMVNSLGKNYTSKIIGYTIIVRKWRKNVR